jgi:exopolyphosphatase/guanosine-5'-triphosphate,3'-diphosphate pyrophosphatase
MTTPGVATIVVGDETTTITVIDHEGLAASVELPVGGVVIQQRHIHDDPPLPEQLTNAIGEVLDHLDDAKREIESLMDMSGFQLSGPAPRAVAAVEVGATIAEDEFVLTRDAAEDVFRTLATETHAQRRHNPGLPADLVPTIVGGCCVVVALLRSLHLDVVTVVGIRR